MAAVVMMLVAGAIEAVPARRSTWFDGGLASPLAPAAVTAAAHLAAQPDVPMQELDWRPSSGPGEVRGVLAGGGVIESAVGQLSSGCTATVIPSRSRRIAVTAAHCVYVPKAAPWRALTPDLPTGWRTEGLEFWPGRVDDTAPYEVWAVEQAFVDQGWLAEGDVTLDFAFLLVAPREGAVIQDVVGAEGIFFNHEQARPAVTVIGYPGLGRFDGRSPRLCSSNAADRIPDTPYFAMAGRDQWAIDCQMARGASGGPWLADFDSATGLGYIIGVTASGDSASSFLTGTPLREEARLLLEQVDDVGSI